MDRDEDSASQVTNELIVANNPSTMDPWQCWIAERAEVFLLYARQQTRSEEDAHDVLQEALAETWRRAHGEIPDQALVFATIRRRAIDAGRAAGSRARREAAHASLTEAWFQPDPSTGDTHRAVGAALGELPEHLRECVTLKLWGDLTFPQIAEITGVPVATATSRYRYAIERLRETLTPMFS